MSFSKSLDTAQEFADNYEGHSTYAPMLIHLQLSGVAGKDVADISAAAFDADGVPDAEADEQEVLLMPGAKFQITEERQEQRDGQRFTELEAREVE